MKRLILTMFCLSVFSVNAQGVMALFEAETESIPTFNSVMDFWMGAVKKGMEMDDAKMYVFREQGTRNLKLVQWFDSKKAMIEHMDKQEASQEKIQAAMKEMTPMEEGTFEKFGETTDFKEASVWEYMPELSTTPETWSPLTKEERDEHKYRRVQFIDVKMNNDNAFEDNAKKQNELDKKLGIKYHLAVFKSVFGARDADYMVVLIDKSRFEYHKNWDERMKVRNANEEWKEFMKADNLGKWSVMGESNWNRINKMTY